MSQKRPDSANRSAQSPPKATSSSTTIKSGAGDSPARSSKKESSTAASEAAVKKETSAAGRTPDRSDASRKVEKMNSNADEPVKASAGRKATPQKAPTTNPSSAVAATAGKPPLGGGLAAASTSDSKPSSFGAGDAFAVPPKRVTPKKSASKSPDPVNSLPPQPAEAAPPEDISPKKTGPKRPSPKPKPASAAPPVVVMPPPQEIRTAAITRLLTAIYAREAPEKLSLAGVISKEFSGAKEAMLFQQLEAKYPKTVAKGFPAAEAMRLEKLVTAEFEEKIRASSSPTPAVVAPPADGDDARPKSTEAAASSSPPSKSLSKPGAKPGAKPSGKPGAKPSSGAAPPAPAPAAASAPALDLKAIRIQAVTQMLVGVYATHAKEKLPLASSIANEFSGPKEANLFAQLEAKYNVSRGFPTAEVNRIEQEIISAATAAAAAAAAAASTQQKVEQTSMSGTGSTVPSPAQQPSELTGVTISGETNVVSPTVPMEIYDSVPVRVTTSSATPLSAAQLAARSVMVDALSKFYGGRMPAQCEHAAALLARHEGFENQLFSAMEERHKAPPGEIRSLMEASAPARVSVSPSPAASNQRRLFVDHVEDVWETVANAQQQSPERRAQSVAGGNPARQKQRRTFSVREQLQYFCDKYCPSKSSTIDTALEVFAGREAELIVRLHEKHNVLSSEEYLPTDADAAAMSRDLAPENLPPSLKPAVDFARFYGLGPQYVPKIVLEIGSSDPDAVMFELLCVVFPDAVESAFADDGQILSHVSRRVCEFLAYHNPSKLPAVAKYVRHYHGKGLDHALSDLLLWSYGDLLKRVKLKSFQASDLVPPDEGPPSMQAASKLEAAVRHGEFRKSCERWAQHFGASGAVRFSRSTPRELGKLGDMFDAATTTEGLLSTAEKDVLTSHREEEVMRILGLREVACETEIKHDSGISYRSARDREARGLSYEPSLAELRRERHVELFGALPPAPLIARDAASGEVFVTDPTIFLDDPACPRCTVLENQLSGALKKLQEMRLDAQVRERLRVFDELGTAPLARQPDLPFNTSAHPLPRYLPQSYYPTTPPSPRASPERSRHHQQSGFFDDCETCKELRQQLNYLSQKLHHLRIAKADGLAGGGSVGQVGGVSTPSASRNTRPHVAGTSGSVWDALNRSTAIASPFGRLAGTMRDEGTMSSLSVADISRLESLKVLDQL